MTETIRAVDLFCGAGGTLEGLAQACDELGYDLDVTAVNHWETAIETHRITCLGCGTTFARSRRYVGDYCEECRNGGGYDD